MSAPVCIHIDFVSVLRSEFHGFPNAFQELQPHIAPYLVAVGVTVWATGMAHRNRDAWVVYDKQLADYLLDSGRFTPLGIEVYTTQGTTFFFSRLK